MPDESPSSESTEAIAQDPASAPEEAQSPRGIDSKDLAAQITAAVSRQLQEFQSSMESKLLKQQKSAQPTPEPGDQEVDWENDFYTDAKGTMKRFAKSLREEITSDLTQRYEAERFRTEFWSGFYSANPRLKAHSDIVGAILSTKESAWKKEGITVEEAYRRLGTLSKGLQGEEEGQQGDDGHTIDGLAFITQDAKPRTNEKIRTMSDAIRDRQSKIRKGLNK